MMTPCTQSGWVQFFCHDQRGGDFPLRKLTVRVMKHLNDSCANFGPEMQLQLSDEESLMSLRLPKCDLMTQYARCSVKIQSQLSSAMFMCS